MATLDSFSFSAESDCTLAPVWSAGIASYSCRVAHYVTSVVLRQESLVASCGSTSTALSGPSPLIKGVDNTVFVVATADDDTTTTTYTFVVHRLSDISTLTSLKLYLDL